MIFKGLIVFFKRCKKIFNILSITWTFLSLATATSFAPINIHEQVKDASAIIYGTYMEKVYKTLPNRGTVTEVGIKIIKSVGLKRSELVNVNEFKVLYPGGIWQGIVTAVHGAPNFRAGEEVVLMLNSAGPGYWIMDLAMGKYSVKTEAGKKYLISEFNSQNPDMVKITMSEFEKLVFEITGDEMSEIKSDKYIQKNTQQNPLYDRREGNKRLVRQNTRVMASTEKSSSDESIFYSLLIFALLGIIFTFMLKKKSE